MLYPVRFNILDTLPVPADLKSAVKKRFDHVLPTKQERRNERITHSKKSLTHQFLGIKLFIFQNLR